MLDPKVTAILSFTGEWLVFVFSLLQAFLELSEQDRFIKKFEISSRSYRKVPAWYWVFPPYKIYREQQLLYRILADEIITEEDFQETMGFMHRAVAWLYISIGGVIAATVSMDEVWAVFRIQASMIAFWLIILGLIGFSFGYVRYRVSHTRAALFRRRFLRYRTIIQPSQTDEHEVNREKFWR